MIQREIINTETGERLITFEDDNFEYVDPIEYYGGTFIFERMILSGVSKEELKGKKDLSINNTQILLDLRKCWGKLLSGYRAIDVPENLIKLLSTNKKKEQINLLKGLVLTPDILMSFLIKAYEDFGFTLSQYSSEFQQRGLELSRMPLACQIKKNGELKLFGETGMSEGELKQAAEHRKVVIAKFLDRKDEWHCFLTTFKSLRGEETWQGENQPHFHYISNKFNLKRSTVIEQIKSEKYQLGKLPHIKLEKYGYQPSK